MLLLKDGKVETETSLGAKLTVWEDGTVKYDGTASEQLRDKALAGCPDVKETFSYTIEDSHEEQASAKAVHRYWPVKI